MKTPGTGITRPGMKGFGYANHHWRSGQWSRAEKKRSRRNLRATNG